MDISFGKVLSILHVTEDLFLFIFFMPRHQKSGGVLCYTLWNFECPSVRTYVRPSVRQRPHHSSARNSSYSFRPILFKLYRRF